MAPLPEALRRKLEKTVVEARDKAEAGALAALKRLAVGEPETFATMSPVESYLRERLRAHALQLGDRRNKSGEQEIQRLCAECAYEHWHRMLFARFLAENRLLIHAEHGVPVTLAECEELAAEEGEEDGWALAGRFAARMLPAIFRPDDPVLEVRLAPEHQQALEKLLADLPPEVFTADDGLGWVYQFWQTKRKKAVNQSGVKIGADELPAVTQLFTEPYMVHFLLHNTLGAWWAGKVLSARPELAETAASEEELRAACALPDYEWKYLRFVRPGESGTWRPAAGTFDGWPVRCAEIKVLDPCCGSGHFLVEAFRILVALRKAEDGALSKEACEAVLRDNLFGLEIDERCTQIAAFNLALAAWTYPGASGYRSLPELNIACSGLSVGESRDEWAKLVPKVKNAQLALRWLNDEFQYAFLLGSLLEPSKSKAAKLINWPELQPLLQQALGHKEVQRDAAVVEAGITAQGMARAAMLLTSTYTLVVTNVPYLGRGRQDDDLRTLLMERYREGKGDLATAFVLRCLYFCSKNGSVAFVTSQNWLFLKTYVEVRKSVLDHQTWNAIARLGPGAFGAITGEVVNVALLVLSAAKPSRATTIVGIDASAAKSPIEKAALLRGETVPSITQLSQMEQRGNPNAVISFDSLAGNLLKSSATSAQGIKTGDDDRWRRVFWEVKIEEGRWRLLQSTVEANIFYGGRQGVIDWGLQGYGFARLQGMRAWDRSGVAVKLMGRIPATLYTGEIFDSNISPITPHDPNATAAIWCFCQDGAFAAAVRKLNSKLSIAEGTVVKVPFELAHWQRVATERYPNGLPEPESDDPTQWLFHGRPEASTAPLQVGVARLLGYHWPAELDESMRLSSRARALVHSCTELLDLADADGIVCIPPTRGELPAADQLQRLLMQAFGAACTPANLPGLLNRESFSGRTLEDWLRDGFFEQHCQRFLQRPFIWHIWDGRRRDGFAALVNYHKLDRKLLERLTYTVLGDWITYQRQGVKAGELGAEDRLAAAEALQRKLALIHEGEPPYDIFVRWKPLKAQPIGWEPDLNDGVRMNIRPFVEAGVLRKDPRIKWTKDRGAEPQSLRSREEFPWFWKDGRFIGERVNDIHLTNAEKRAARAAGEK